eukprot:TRINITY_DN2185_c1_g1_i1.p1 TRINITY_DN2185_c1_g1~~TRINITY_DN2185_c1_g1_i1.p1  ORF type:complete len:416 (-),score=62.34 TRINITY_DN2185_c1_g1_i1:51-1298(-)
MKASVSIGTLLIVCCCCWVAQGLDNGLGLTPAMGYNTWYDVQCSDMMHEQTVRDTADAIVRRGMHKLGYTYVNLDDCWAGGRDANGRVYADKKAFPSGIASLARYMHNKGLKFGLYTDRGNLTCAKRPGSAGHTTIDAQTYASWGVDFLKEDSCWATQDHAAAFAEYALMRDALNATGRPIFFDLCGWESWYAPVGKTLGNEWRIGPDTTTWPDILTNINVDADLAPWAGPGGWNNPCLLIGKSYNGNMQITELQSRAQFSMWAVLAAPLMLSMDLRNMTAYAEATYTNAQVIAVNQDPLGKQGVRIVGRNLTVTAGDGGDATNVWARPLSTTTSGDAQFAVMFFNVGASSADVTCDSACLSRLGYRKNDMRLYAYDYWTQAVSNFTVGSGYTARNLVAKGGFQLVRISTTPRGL